MDIAADTIAKGNIADNAVDGTKIASNSILTRHIDDNQITSDQIAGNTIALANIADNAVNGTKIAQNSIAVKHIPDALITTTQIAANTIATGNIADNAVDGTKIAQNSILTRHIDDGQVDTAQLAADAVTQAKLADNAVVTANIVAGNVDTTELADDAVTAAKIDAGALAQTFTGTQTIPIINATTRIKTPLLGIQDSNPPQMLHLDEVAGMNVGTGTSSATTEFTLDSFASATFRTAKYLVQVKNSTDSDFHCIEILLFHDGSTVYLTQYASIFDNGAQATFDADINSGNVRLRVTPASGDTMAYKFIRTTIEV